MNYWIEIKFYLMVIAACHVAFVFGLGFIGGHLRIRNKLLAKKMEPKIEIVPPYHPNCRCRMETK